MMTPAQFLRKMISIPAFSTEESARADFVEAYLTRSGLAVERVGNNLLARIICADPGAPVLMLNSHLDTVRPSSGYTLDPFNPPYRGDVIYGLGSNDAGGAVTAMIHAGLYFHHKRGLPYSLLLLLSAEEETSGPEGLAMALPHAGRVDCAIVGEPTQMKAAVAERGLLVLDGMAVGVSGHAARGEGVNAIYSALDDIATLRDYRFERVSPRMGEVKLTVTQIEAGEQHNVVPDTCRFVVDVRPTDCYTPEQIWRELQAAVASTLTPRSLGKCSSATPSGHPLTECAQRMGITTYVSPTTSDWVHLKGIPAIKMGPGDSSRSHTADEYITVAELEQGIGGYVNFLKNLNLK